MKDKDKHYCDNIVCNHNNTEGLCCLFNPDNCKYRQLQKENAELKDDNKVMADNYSKMEQKFYDNLTKAKDHIKKLLGCLQQDTNDPETNYYVVKYMTEAEQFLKEVENV